MVAKRPDRPFPFRMIAGTFRCMRPVKQRWVCRKFTLGPDQCALRQFLAALARDHDLAFRNERGCEIEHDRLLAFARNTDAKRRGRNPPLDTAERRDKD